MKVLIVDDSAEKLKKLIDVLVSAGMDRNSIDVARSAFEGRRRLTGDRYELVILDLLLPARDEDVPSLNSALQLLRDIGDSDDIVKPARLIGFTAYSGVAFDAQSDFDEALWTIVVYDESSSNWEDQFRRVVAYLRSRSSIHHPQDYETDVCIVTALHRPEFEAVLAIPWQWEAPEPMDDSTFVRRGRCPSGGETYSVVAACAPRMGNVAAALLTARLIAAYRPRFVAMAGICAGIRGKLNLCDVVMFSPSWEWASGKIVPAAEGSYLEPAPHQIPIAEFVRARGEHLRDDDAVWRSIKDGFPIRTDVVPKLVIAPGASGPSVVADRDYAAGLLQQHRKLTAIDMECYGVMAAAAAASRPRPTAFGIKAATDFADDEKSDDNQARAAFNSAASVRHFFERYLQDIRPFAGS